MKSVMQQFSHVPSVEMNRSKFDLSRGYKTTFDAGYLVPFFRQEILPGDTFNVSVQGFARLNTPLFPIMDNMFLDTHFFFVPLRQIWSNSRKFFGERLSPGDSIDYAVPVMSSPAVTGHTVGTLADYLGLPTDIPDLEHSSLYHRSFYHIHNEWFRDQNLKSPFFVPTDDGPDVIGVSISNNLSKRGKRGDYFTTCLPSPQKGNAVTLPIGSVAPVLGIGVNQVADVDTPVNVYETATGSTTYSSQWNDGAHTIYIESDGSNAPQVYADLSSATSSTINDIREAFQVQRLLERDMRGGTRYAEIVANHFNVQFYDVSYRPEYLGGGSTPVNISPVASQTEGTNYKVGDLGAMGTISFGGHGFSKSFVEHGIVLGIVSVRADLTYQQGLHRDFSRSTRYDFYWPTLAHLGEQAVLNKEIYAQGSLAATDDDVFGYQERYAEYRYGVSQITGKLRSTYSTPLDAWHLSQEFTSLPTLGSTFIDETPPIARVVQTPSEPHFIFDSYSRVVAARPMPVFGTPGMIDHF